MAWKKWTLRQESVHLQYELKDNTLCVKSLIRRESQMSVYGLLAHNGHVHDSLDYSIGKTRVLANPRGYAKNINTARNVDALEWENSAYDQRLVVDI
jgi:hypothetical protein